MTINARNLAVLLEAAKQRYAATVYESGSAGDLHRAIAEATDALATVTINVKKDAA